MAQLLFYDDKHRYELDGTELTSVSELTKSMSSLNIDECMGNTLDVAAERGVICHKVIELILSGENVDGEYPAQYQPYVDGIVKFLAENDIIPIYIEKPFASEILGIAGTPDLICLFNGILTITDNKFVSSVDKSSVSAKLNAYRKICEENGIHVESLQIIQFMNTGEYRPYDVEISDEDVNLLLKLKERKNRKHPRGRIV